jgi:pilus assembly protein CpaB
MWKVKRMKPARIIVLVIALVAGGIAALLAGRSDQPAPAPEPVAQLETTEILVANSDIGLGQILAVPDMRWQMWPSAAAGPAFIRKSDRPDAINQLVGAITRASFSSGEPVRELRLIRANGSGYMAAILPTGTRAISTEVNSETGAAGFILPNDHVDVILTRRDRQAEKAAGVEVHASETILSNIRVLAVDQTVEEKAGQKVIGGNKAVVTLQLTPRQAETMTVSRQLGTIWLALRPLVDAEVNGVPEDDRPNRGSVNVVRFGVTTLTQAK